MDDLEPPQVREDTTPQKGKINVLMILLNNYDARVKYLAINDDFQIVDVTSTPRHLSFFLPLLIKWLHCL